MGGLAGYSWGDYVAHLAAEHGSLAAVALKLAELASEGIASGWRARSPRQRGCLTRRATISRLRSGRAFKCGGWDQRAYQKNNPPVGERPDIRAYGRYKLGDRAAAVELAEAAIRHAGDGGYIRLRAMALNLLARILGAEEGAAARGRALAIAKRLEDEELLGRIERGRRPSS